MRDPVTCARELIGCELRWKRGRGVIVETEAYSALNDEACHTFSRPSSRRFIADHPPGAAYIYLNLQDCPHVSTPKASTFPDACKTRLG